MQTAIPRRRSKSRQLVTSLFVPPCSGQVRPRQGTEICNFGAPSPLDALRWIFGFFSSIYVQFSKTSPLKSGEKVAKNPVEKIASIILSRLWLSWFFSALKQANISTLAILICQGKLIKAGRPDVNFGEFDLPGVGTGVLPQTRILHFKTMAVGSWLRIAWICLRTPRTEKKRPQNAHLGSPE